MTATTDRIFEIAGEWTQRHLVRICVILMILCAARMGATGALPLYGLGLAMVYAFILGLLDRELSRSDKIFDDEVELSIRK